MLPLGEALKNVQESLYSIPYNTCESTITAISFLINKMGPGLRLSHLIHAVPHVSEGDLC